MFVKKRVNKNQARRADMFVEKRIEKNSLGPSGRHVCRKTNWKKFIRLIGL